jgi:hypothetical protein
LLSISKTQPSTLKVKIPLVNFLQNKASSLITYPITSNPLLPNYASSKMTPKKKRKEKKKKKVLITTTLPFIHWLHNK